MRSGLLAYIRKVEGWLSDHEARFLFTAAKYVQADGEIVEIGSWKGKSTIALAMGARASGRKRHVWAVDPHTGMITKDQKKEESTLPEFTENLRKAGIAGYVKPVVAPSSKAAKKWNGSPIAVLFVDGLHDFAHAREDYLLWSPYVRNGSMLAFHDGFCGIPGVTRMIRECIFTREDIFDVGTIGSILYVIRGNPDPARRVLTQLKIRLIMLAERLHAMHLPRIAERIVIHRLFRLLLANGYTLKTYS